MKKLKGLSTAVLVLLVATIATSIDDFAQQNAKSLVCKPAVLAAFKPLPKLKYRCDAKLNDYDEKVLKQPNRISAIKALERTLGTFTNAAWWQASVDDLNFCELRRKPGALSPEEQERIRNQEYAYDLFGNHSVRLALLRDPCYMSGYSSNAFLLYRKAGKVFVTDVLDGFSSRADNPVDLNFADLNGQQIIEISTGTGGLHASFTYYYFAIEAKTNRAVPKKLFKFGDKGLTNVVSSDLLMGDPEDFGLPKDATELNIIRGHKLAPSFSIYAEDNKGKIESEQGGKFTRTILKWNGRFYQ